MWFRLIFFVGFLVLSGFSLPFDEEFVRDEMLQEMGLNPTEDEEERSLANLWAVRIEGDDPEEIAHDVAKRYGMINHGKIGSLDGYYELEYSGARRQRRSHVEHTKRLAEHPRIKWVQQQQILERHKREARFIDPMYVHQWYLENNGQVLPGPDPSGETLSDINVVPVWNRGITGKGVTVAVLDDGLDHDHPDIHPNFDAEASTDLNDRDRDPKPNDKDPYNAHGTKCGGEIAAKANNSICGVGVAYEASIGGVRMLDGPATDSLEAGALSFNSHHVDIYSNCWGPKDDGKTFGRPGPLASRALKDGVTTGRGGKGSIYVWATGNGGLADDDCNCDGYTTSIYTISIGAVSSYGLSTYYDEMCSSTLAVTFTADSHHPNDGEPNPLVTTDLHNGCTSRFQGTSSAAPIAAGIIALVLEVNPNLGWRDVQHLIVHTARKTSPLDEGWQTNDAGFTFNHKFGFGALDADGMVQAAMNWTNVAEHHECKQKPRPGHRFGDIPGGGHLSLKLETDGCEGTAHEITKLEHVLVTISLKHRRRGDLSIILISPRGTKNELLSTRRYDASQSGLKDWSFSTVHCWGEDPRGVWTIILKDNPDAKYKRMNKKNDIEDFEKEMIDRKRARAHRKKDYIPQPRHYDYPIVPNNFVRDEIHHGRNKEDYMRDLTTDDLYTREKPDLDDNWYDHDYNSGNKGNKDNYNYFDYYEGKHSVAGSVEDWSITFYGSDR